MPGMLYFNVEREQQTYEEKNQMGRENSFSEEDGKERSKKI